MNRIFHMCLDAGLASIILALIFPILNKWRFHSSVKSLFYFIFAVYLSGMFAVVGLPTVTYFRFDPRFNVIPFAYMFSDYRNSLLNVLLFMPLGFFLPIFWKFFGSAIKTVLFGFCTSLLIESLQIFTFRATDINDLMTNTLGTFLGWIIAKIFLRYVPSVRSSIKTMDVYLLCATSFGVMFFLQPFLAELVFSFIL